MGGLSKTAWMMMASVAGVCVAVWAAGLAVYFFIYPFEPPPAYTLGLTLGGVQSVIKVVWLEKSILKAMDAGAENASGTAYRDYLGRFLMTAATLAIAFAFRNIFGVFGTVFGVFSLRIAGFITGRLLKNAPAEGENSD
jgi:uncharacterized RDD family membrane protein YckC